MGRPIVYCADCGSSLREEDFEKRRAHSVDRQSYCASCRPLPEAAPARPKSGGSLPSVTPRPRRAESAPPPKRSPLPWIIGGAALLLIVVVIAALSSRPAPRPAEKPVPARAVEARPAPAPAPKTGDLDLALIEVRRLRARANTPELRAEIRARLNAAGDLAGPRMGEVDRLLAECEKDWTVPPPSPSKRVLLSETFEAGLGRFNRGEIVEAGGTKALSLDAEGSEILNPFPGLIGAGTVLRVRLKPLADLEVVEIILWGAKGRANAWHHARGLRKGEWTSIDIRLATLRLGYRGDGGSLEGDVPSTLRFYFDNGPPGARVLLDDVEVAEEK